MTASSGWRIARAIMLHIHDSSCPCSAGRLRSLLISARTRRAIFLKSRSKTRERTQKDRRVQGRNGNAQRRPIDEIAPSCEGARSFLLARRDNDVACVGDFRRFVRDLGRALLFHQARARGALPRRHRVDSHHARGRGAVPIAWRRGVLRPALAHRRAVIAFAIAELAIPFSLVALGEQWISRRSRAFSLRPCR